MSKKIPFIGGIAIIVAALIVFVFVSEAQNPLPQALNPEYHFVMVCENLDDPFWQSIKLGATEAAKDLNVLVEFCDTQGFSIKEEEIKYVDIATLAKVDGIITHVDNERSLAPYIDKAENANIPVITIIDDAPSSKRHSFVGVNNYNLGIEWGKQIIGASGGVGNVVMLSTHRQSTQIDEQDVSISGIKQVIKNYPNITFDSVAINRSGVFDIEETVRRQILDGNATILLCANANTTVTAAQAVVELNKVGQINIIGYHDSEEIIKLIEAGVIYGTIASDAYGMGYNAVKALVEIKQTSHTSEFFTTKLNSITAQNYDEYIKDNTTTPVDN